MLNCWRNMLSDQELQICVLQLLSGVPERMGGGGARRMQEKVAVAEDLSSVHDEG